MNFNPSESGPEHVDPTFPTFEQGTDGIELLQAIVNQASRRGFEGIFKAAEDGKSAVSALDESILKKIIED